MKFLNLSSCSDQDPKVMQASLTQVGAWYFLQCYCHRHMNGGKIRDGKEWPNESWQRLGLTKDLIFSASPLWHFRGSDLEIHGYNKTREEKYRRRKLVGKANVMKRWHPSTNGSEKLAETERP